MSEFRIVDDMLFYPQRCMRCKLPKLGDVMDTGIDLPEGMGRIYFCHDCQWDFAKAAGFITNDDAQLLRAEALAAGQRELDFTTLLEGASDAILNIAHSVDRQLRGADTADTPVIDGLVGDVLEVAEIARGSVETSTAAQRERQRPSIQPASASGKPQRS